MGRAGQALDGLAFTARYTLTAPTADAHLFSDGAAQAEIWGGSYYSAPSPLSVTLTINGITQSAAGDYKGEAFQWNRRFGDFDNVSHLAEDNYKRLNPVTGGVDTLDNYVTNGIRGDRVNIFDSIDYTAPLSYETTGDELFNGGAFNFYFPDGATARVTKHAYGNFRNARIMIAAVGVPGETPVPEPAAWAMLIPGFGGIGVVARRHGAVIPRPGRLRRSGGERRFRRHRPVRVASSFVPAPRRKRPEPLTRPRSSRK